MIELETRRPEDVDTFTCRTCKHVCRYADGTRLEICSTLEDQEPIQKADVDLDRNYCELYTAE